jgi:hypothetical protein
LNRAEYANAIEDLLGIRIDSSALLPKDDEADGFDNVASVLTVSPSFLDQYISAARVVTARAMGNPAARPGSTTYRPARGTDQAVRVEGLPLGTRGGLIVEHIFPADGDYKLNINGLATAGYVRGMEYRHTLIVTVDGAKVFEGQLGGEEDIRAIDQQQASAVAAINGRFQNIPLKVTAGPHKVGVTFVARTFAESDEVLFSFRPGSGEERIQRVGSIEIQGPFTPAGVERYAESSAHLRLSSQELVRRAPVRDDDPLVNGASGIPSSGDGSGSGRADVVLQRGSRGRAPSTPVFRPPFRDSRQPEVPVSRRAYAVGHSTRRCSQNHIGRSGVASLVLPARSSSGR